MPDRPTEEQVRGLMTEYAPLSKPLDCKACKKPMRPSYNCNGDQFYYCGKCDITSWVEDKHDPSIVGLCEDWLRWLPVFKTVDSLLKARNDFTCGSDFRLDVARSKVLTAIDDYCSAQSPLSEEPHA